MKRAIYNKLASLRTSVYLLGLISLFYLLGTIFPQGGDLERYREAGGGLVEVVGLFDLLNIFTSPLFLLAALLLLLNLVVCSYDKLIKIIASRKALPLNHHRKANPEFTLDIDENILDAEGKLKYVLTKELRFKELYRVDALVSGHWHVLEKGLYYRWLTWSYHAAIIACFVGFIVSGLFVKEGVLILKPGEPEKVISDGEKLGWLISKDHPAPDFEIVLDRFETEYTEFPHLEYPTDVRSKLAVGLGWKKLSYDLNDDSLIPKDWFSRLRIVRDGSTLKEKTIELNDPLRYKGYTFYQMAYDQVLTLRLGADEVTARAMGTLEDDSIDGALKFGTLRIGTVTHLDGTTSELKPFVMVKSMTTEEDGSKKYHEVVKLELDTSVNIAGTSVELTGYKENSILSYRYDPGVPLLWVFGSLVFILMTIRCFGSWYRLSYVLKPSDSGSRLALVIDSRGIFSDPSRIRKRLLYYLGS